MTCPDDKSRGPTDVGRPVLQKIEAIGGSDLNRR